MKLNEYQNQALKTAGDKTKNNEFFHLVLGLVGESGEIAEKVKKLIRDHDSDLSKLDTDDLKKELGDVLWYIAVLGDYLDIKLEDIAATNVKKLASRQSRGKLSGSGDNR